MKMKVHLFCLKIVSLLIGLTSLQNAAVFKVYKKRNVGLSPSELFLKLQSLQKKFHFSSNLSETLSIIIN